MQRLQKRKYQESFYARKRRRSRIDIWIGSSPDVTKRGHAKGQVDTAWAVETTFYHKNTRCQSAGGAPKVGEVDVLGSYGRFSVVHLSRELTSRPTPTPPQVLFQFLAIRSFDVRSPRAYWE